MLWIEVEEDEDLIQRMTGASRHKVAWNKARQLSGKRLLAFTTQSQRLFVLSICLESKSQKLQDRFTLMGDDSSRAPYPVLFQSLARVCITNRHNSRIPKLPGSLKLSLQTACSAHCFTALNVILLADSYCGISETSSQILLTDSMNLQQVLSNRLKLVFVYSVDERGLIFRYSAFNKC
jgi:hypothetical protein